MPRKEVEDLKSFIFFFANNNALDTSDKLTKVESLHDIMNKNLKQLGFFYIFTPFTNKWHHTLRRITASKRSEQRAFALDTNILHYALQTVTLASLIHILMLNMVDE